MSTLSYEAQHRRLRVTGSCGDDDAPRIHEAVPVPLVLHGSSGVPAAALRAGIQHGMTKINIGTLLNVAFTGPVRSVLAGSPALVDPRTYLAEARSAVADAVADSLLGIAGR